MTLACLVLLLFAAPPVESHKVLSVPVKDAFENTLKRWSIQTTDSMDLKERWLRFQKSVSSVEQTSKGSLDSLNPFTVMNNAEYGLVERRLLHNNATADMPEFYKDAPLMKLSGRSRRTTYDNNTFWTDTVGFNAAKDQLSCGSCWSFPTTALFEIKTKNISGEVISFSEQLFVDCTFTYDGCSGGLARDGIKITADRQYLSSTADYPYTAYYVSCPLASEIEDGTDNAMTKIWMSSYDALPMTSETYMLPALEISPVTFVISISTNLMSYSGGIYEDTTCTSDPSTHVLLFVAYDADSYTMRNSYGSAWGESGYIRYQRGSTYFFDCTAGPGYTINAVERREYEYTYCNSKVLSTKAECETSCEGMNTGDIAGWTLAIIPTLMHNMIVANKVNGDYPGVKGDDKFNYVWIGLSDEGKTYDYAWADGYTPYQYQNHSSYDSTGKYGMVNKNTGEWMMKNSDTYKARGMCSRPITCFDISSSVEYGDVSYSNSSRYLGTTATVSCDTGSTMTVGTGAAETLTCVAGLWDADLPTCSQGTVNCDALTVGNGTVSPSGSVSDGTVVDITCNSGYFMSSGNPERTCQSGSYSGILPTCEKVEEVCSTVTVADGVVSGASQPTSTGDVISVTCNSGYTLSGDDVLLCNGTHFNGTTPSCGECNELSVENGVLTEASETEVMVACISNAYELIGTNSLTCERCLDDYTHDTLLCKSPTFNPLTVPKCRLIPGSCPGGSYNTEDGCATCPENHWLPAGSNSPIGGCKKCPGTRTSSAGSSSVSDCRYTLCTCKVVSAGGSKYKSSCNCL